MNEKQPQPSPGDQPEHEASREREPELNPRVWIGSLADYNNGALTGEWVDAAVDDEQLISEAQRIVANSEELGAEEYAIFDYDDFGDFRPEQYEQLTTVAKVARGIQEHGPVFATWAQLHDADPDMLDAFEDSYLGEYDSPEAWAREVLGDSDIEQRIETEFGDHLAPYIRIDYEAWARDAWLSDDVYVCHKDDGGCWIFRIM
ncbi:antirestriction protein ArdA [Flexivirga oryzae]|uniref:Antirestriction protein n=1 Tax=Flexivirga oryzae TaxID=1794944 RepID=A0A839N4F0_9MICO|nr:antirestriction protein ArdA [Flexivirga oryzae]MBB2890944.1 antirestriction protein [Flexivirga oryzae]